MQAACILRMNSAQSKVDASPSKLSNNLFHLQPHFRRAGSWKAKVPLMLTPSLLEAPNTQGAQAASSVSHQLACCHVDDGVRRFSCEEGIGRSGVYLDRYLGEAGWQTQPCRENLTSLQDQSCHLNRQKSGYLQRGWPLAGRVPFHGDQHLKRLLLLVPIVYGNSSASWIRSQLADATPAGFDPKVPHGRRFDLGLIHLRYRKRPSSYQHIRQWHFGRR